MAGARDDDPSAKFGALLQPHLSELAPTEPTKPEPEPPQRLDEAELMALIFTCLDDDNPRVCEGIDFDRLMILTEPEPPVVVHALEPEPNPAHEPPPCPSPVRIDIRPSEWTGRSWADAIDTVPAELLDRPTPHPSWTRLRARADARPLDTVNLRRLGRDAALRHLALFVHACRAKGHRLCRVITGKGVESRAEPVLKRAAVEWCLRADEVLDWAPWLDRHGEWGALILELRSASATAKKPS